MELDISKQTASTILCCMCATPIQANPANMCVSCLRGQVDITEGIPKQLILSHCRGCGRYSQPPGAWLYCELESKELLALCLKRIKLNKVKLVDAGFVWTEPHSKRVKVKLTIQKEVMRATILQQIFIVEFTVSNLFCDQCHRLEAKDTWNASAQVRQKVNHKRTFLWLEQLILRYNAHQHTSSIKVMPDGLDFYFSTRSHCVRFTEFLQEIVPVKLKSSKKLISQDYNSNTFNYKYTFSVEIIPICRDDLVVLPPKLCSALGGFSSVVLCHKITGRVNVVDPWTLKCTELSIQQYTKYPFHPVLSSKQLIPFTVLDVTPLGTTNGKWTLAEVQVARSVDLGMNDTIFTVTTHLGHLLKPGDTAYGYDVAAANFAESFGETLKGAQVPEIVLVRKGYPLRRKRQRSRYWKLRHLTKEEEEEPTSRKRADDSNKERQDYEQFLQDLEEDPELRSQINLYKERNAREIAQRIESEVLEEDEREEATEFPDVSLNELLDDMSELAIEDEEATVV